MNRKLNGEEEIFSVTKIYSDEKESFEGAFSSIEKTNQKKEKIIKGLEDLAKQRKELVELRENKQKLEDLSKEEKVKVIQLELQVARLLKESKKIRNILLIGRTGNGKSTLGNVLINKNENFEEVFKESNYAASQTKELGIEEFEYDGIKYRIIDTIGFGDTELTEKEVLDKISEVAYSISDGLDQVLFVTKSRFTEEEKNVFNLLKNVLFDETIGKYTTIVRTNFPDFDKPEERQNDIKSMSKDNKTSDVIINSCNNKIIHVDNHPKIKENRDKSRKILLSHLAKCKGVYYPNNLKDLVSRIKSYEEIERKNREEIKKLEESRNKLEKENNEEREKLTRRIEELEKEKKDAEENRRQETREHVENRCSK
ncbi:6814_t:CDS:2 [Funneliformis geosporum]|uniref:6814_t:CDS:1 n=1 Tax=Funneliformis geosporum TaxID=1117311 RepID=A0A9W4SAX6_9GLOM|nr:6814_t:CDS:2 [Funneliformis geosporum]